MQTFECDALDKRQYISFKHWGSFSVLLYRMQTSMKH